MGADVNTASAPLLARISGLTATTAKNIVSFRDANGPFRNRQQITKVPRLGDRTFQLAAGFLRITGGDNPLDASAVHPERYALVIVGGFAGSIDFYGLLRRSGRRLPVGPSKQRIFHPHLRNSARG